jgi:5-methylcytosine-specific restriction endonuclease McrA
MTEAEIKAAVRERDGQRCAECGMTAADHLARSGATLHVHRIVPGSVYSLPGCVTLCSRCHRQRHRKPNVRPHWLTFKTDTGLHDAAKRTARLLKIPLQDYIDRILRPQIERDHARVIRRIVEENKDKGRR